MVVVESPDPLPRTSPFLCFQQRLSLVCALHPRLSPFLLCACGSSSSDDRRRRRAPDILLQGKQRKERRRRNLGRLRRRRRIARSRGEETTTFPLPPGNMTTTTTSATEAGSTTAQPEDKMCRQLALEGERHCKLRQFNEGIRCFERALDAGTADLELLSSIYNELGIAYYACGDFTRAVDLHNMDWMLCRGLHDAHGEASALGNLANAYAQLRLFEHAAQCGRRQLKLTQDTQEKSAELRALYTLGCVHLRWAEHSIHDTSETDGPSANSSNTKQLLAQAMDHLKSAAERAKALHEDRLFGMACGSLGSAAHLAGEYEQAVEHYKKRLEVARQYNDRRSVWRTLQNIAGSSMHIVDGEDEARASYEQALRVARDLGDSSLEARSSFSLAVLESAAGRLDSAIELHSKHLSLARKLTDAAGEARAHQCLARLWRRKSDYPKAAYFLARRRQLAARAQDADELARWRASWTSLIRVSGGRLLQDDGTHVRVDASAEPDEAERGKELPDELLATSGELKERRASRQQQEDLIEMLQRVQGRQLDDQRAALAVFQSRDPATKSQLAARRRQRDVLSSMVVDRDESSTDVSRGGSNNNNNARPDAVIDMIVAAQRRRMNDQRAALAAEQRLQLLERLREAGANENGGEEEARRLAELDEQQLYELVLKSQAQRLDDQRSELPPRTPTTAGTERAGGGSNGESANGKQKPADVTKNPEEEEELGRLVDAMRRGRYDDQRAELKKEDD